MYYINCFFIYSIIGFIFEHIVYLFLKHNGDSGIFYGPWTPVYGFGVIMIILVSKYISKNLHASQFLKTLVFFISTFVLLTVIELIGGILIEKIFKITFWDYSNLRFNIGKYIALEISFAWGIISILIIYFVKPIIDKLINIIPNYITILLIIIFSLDMILTVINKTKIKSLF